MKKESGEKTASKNSWLLGSSSFLNDVGGDMIAPILPFYISLLGGEGVAIGLVSGLREGLASIFKIFGGWLSDRLGKRKGFVFFGYFFSFIFKFFIALANSWQQIMLFVSLERFGKLRDAPRDAIISESRNNKGKNFGIAQMLDTLGAVVGTILVLVLFLQFNLEFKKIIFIAAAISFFSIIPIFFVKEPKFKKTKKQIIEGISSLDKRLKYFVLVASVFSFGNFGLYMFIILIAQELSGNMVYPLVLYVIFNLVFAVFVIPFGKLSDKIGRKKVLISGYALFFLVALGFIYLKSFFWLFLLFPVYGLVYAITNSNQRALVSDLAGNMKGTALGFFHMCTGIVAIPGGFIAGFLWNISHELMFSYISVVAFIAIILLIFVREKTNSLE